MHRWLLLLLMCVSVCMCCSMREDIPPFDSVKFNSYYYEIGERSFMKEHLAYQVGNRVWGLVFNFQS